MANGKRLIDANAMREDWLENGENEYVYDTNAVLDSIDAQSVVDAVEVVRCEKCLYRSQYCNENGLYECGELQTKDGDLVLMVKPDFFCAFGERRGKMDGGNENGC